MQKTPLFNLIHTVRQNLKEIGQFGKLISEKFLITDGEFVGQWFCFENADVRWRFDSNQAEALFGNGKTQELEVLHPGVGPSQNPSDSQEIQTVSFPTVDNDSDLKRAA